MFSLRMSSNGVIYACGLHRAVDRIYAPAHILGVGTQKESNDVAAFLRRALSAESCRIIKGCIRWSIMDFPALLHQRSKYGSRGHRVDTHLTDSIFFGSSFCQTYDTMLAGIIRSMFGKP